MGDINNIYQIIVIIGKIIILNHFKNDFFMFDNINI